MADDHFPAHRHDADSSGNHPFWFRSPGHGAGAVCRARPTRNCSAGWRWLGVAGRGGAGTLSTLPLAGTGRFGRAVAADEFSFYFIYLFLLVAALVILGSMDYLERDSPTRRVLCPGPDGNGGDVLHGRLHGSHHDLPGAGDFLHLHLHPGRLPAGRPAFQRSLAEVFSAGIVCHRIFPLWNRLRLWPDGNHQPAGAERAARPSRRNGRRSRRWL